VQRVWAEEIPIYQNLTHFHRLFKKMAGNTPASYREQMTLRNLIQEDD